MISESKSKDITLFKHEIKHSVFINETSDYYGVLGLCCNLNEIITEDNLPCMLHTSIMPFKGSIVFDGIIQSYPIAIGPQIYKRMQEMYEKKTIIFSFPLLLMS